MIPEPWQDHVPPDEEWRLDAACQNTDPEAFFPVKGSSPQPALRFCRMCPVTAECLSFAVETRQQHGVWGGLPAHRRLPLIGRAEKPKRTGCVNGHDWSIPGNVLVRDDGRRMCRPCNAERKRARGRAA